MFSRESFKAAYEKYCEARRAIIEEEKRIRKEFVDAMIAAFEQRTNDADQEYEEEPTVRVRTTISINHFESCKLSVPGHRIPWYTSGFE